MGKYLNVVLVHAVIFPSSGNARAFSRWKRLIRGDCVFFALLCIGSFSTAVRYQLLKVREGITCAGY
jgi:hypothetical protein